MLPLVLALLGAAAPAAPVTSHAPAARAALVDRGDQAFAGRGDPARLAEALDAWNRAAAHGPEDPALDVRIARAEAFRALAGPGDSPAAWTASSRAAERALRRLSPAWGAAVEAGDLVRAAAAVGPEGAEALYWISLATWSQAQAKGLAALLVVKDAALAGMRRAAALDGGLDCGGPHRALGAWTAALPAAAGGGAALSRRHFEQARALGPGCLLTPVAEAGSLLVLLQDRNAFDRALAEVAAAPDSDPRWAPENAVARRLARDLQGRAARLF